LEFELHFRLHHNYKNKAFWAGGVEIIWIVSEEKHTTEHGKFHINNIVKKLGSQKM